MPQGFARLLISGAPYRAPAPLPYRDQRLRLTHADFPPTPPAPPPSGPDGFQQLELEIKLAEEILALMKSRLVTLRARAKKQGNRMATVSKVKSAAVQG
jgi:hypothetical protein